MTPGISEREHPVTRSGLRMAPLEPVCSAVNGLMTEHADKMEASLWSLHETRPDGRTYFDHVHTWFGPIRLMWEHDRPRAVATLRLGPLSGGPGDNYPCVRGRSVHVSKRSLTHLPDTVKAAVTGRRLGDVATFGNPFLERLADEVVVGIAEHADHVEIELAMKLWPWRMQSGE